MPPSALELSHRFNNNHDVIWQLLPFPLVQVMYMYYFLGYKLISSERISLLRKKIKADNTFLLALDGDVDFQPEAVQILVDRMKQTPELGAACGRIHPIGSGEYI